MLEVLGRAVFHLGPLGSGHMMKCISNTVTAMTFQATLEVWRSASRPASTRRHERRVQRVDRRVVDHHNHIGQRILSRTFDDPFRLALMRKDVDIASGPCALNWASTCRWRPCAPRATARLTRSSARAAA
jgi:3-hydroxyisobutyrate dehydrogenase-like beta-hydroxyacid dehydrogenase